jgi:hypothetical protein
LNLSVDALEYFAQIFVAEVNRTITFDAQIMNEMRVAYETWESSPAAQAYRMLPNEYFLKLLQYYPNSHHTIK